MEDTIVALSTATPAALGVLRLSGSLAISAVEALFSPKNGKKFTEEPSRKLIFGTLKDQNGQAMDQVLATYAKGPNTYTGEDTAEVHCHGSPMVLTMALEAFYAQGCRQAEAGEFTQRSFLNGKLDLTQAEAVGDLLEAKSTAAVHQAVGQLGGSLSQKIQGIYGELAGLMAHFCAVLDYPDEDIDVFDQSTMETCLLAQRTALQQLEATWERGRRMTQGIPCALVGLPNAGKSSLLNALLGYDRAIVTPIAGTTRDTIEGEISLGAVSLRLIDTAGLRDSQDPIEQMGVERSRDAMTQAELLLVVVDGSTALTGEEPFEVTDTPRICVVNKSDQKCVISKESLPFEHVCTLSAQKGEGIDELQKVISELFKTNSINPNEVLLSNLRQVEQVRQALAHIQGALDGLAMGLPADAVLSDVEGAMGQLSLLTGKNVSQDVTQEIFTRFCVGK